MWVRKRVESFQPWGSMGAVIAPSLSGTVLLNSPHLPGQEGSSFPPDLARPESDVRLWMVSTSPLSLGSPRAGCGSLQDIIRAPDWVSSFSSI